MSNPSREKGFTVVEVTVALLVLVVCLSCLVPILQRATVERRAVSEREYALTLIHNELSEWSAGRSAENERLTVNGTAYDLQWKEVDPHTVELCVVWQDRSQRVNEACGIAMR